MEDMQDIQTADNLRQPEIQAAERTLEALANERECALGIMNQAAFDSIARQMIRALGMPDETKEHLSTYYQGLINKDEPRYTH
jgi:hypothetical protein